MRHDFDDGKYTVINDNGKLTALRHGEPWQDLCGNNLVYWMLVEVDRLKAERDGLVAVMEGLACLGNGDRYGNSDGNVVAQVALAKYAPTRSAQSTTQPADLSGNA